jgi:hypothetical protein
MSAIYFYNNLNNLLYSLNTYNFKNNKTNDYYSKKIILKSEFSSDNKIYSFNSWFGTFIYGFYVNIIDNYNYIFSLDLIENDDNIKIEHLSINNDYYYSKNNNKFLTDNEVLILKKSIFNYIEDFAISKNKTKIIIDIHQNMKRFTYELKDEGFINSNNRCIDNYYWYEAVKEIKK